MLPQAGMVPGRPPACGQHVTAEFTQPDAVQAGRREPGHWGDQSQPLTMGRTTEQHPAWTQEGARPLAPGATNRPKVPPLVSESHL